MRKSVLCISVLTVVILVSSMIVDCTEYLSNFLNFGILSTLGEIIGVGIKRKRIGLVDNLLQKTIVWGFVGILITIAFPMFISGVEGLQLQGLLPKFNSSKLGICFMASISMDITFGPMMMIFQKIVTLDIELKETQGKRFTQIIKAIDWDYLVKNTWIKTTVFFWIPMHTIIFLLPGTIRLIVAALMSTVLGILLSLTNSKKRELKGDERIEE